MTSTRPPGYLQTHASGALSAKVEAGRRMLESCSVCPRACGVNRLDDERGFCRTGRWAVVSSFHAHHGEERPLSGVRGSGTIFFAHCNLRCMYCQNYDISQLGHGRETSAEALAQMMGALQEVGCHNVNLVTPSHVVPQIVEALSLAVEEGLSIPVVYNTSSYDGLDALRLLDGIVDLYLADLKYTDDEMAERYSHAPNYTAVSQEAIREMYRQVGDLVMDEQGIAQQGLIIRHLVLPNGLAGTDAAMRFLAKEISPHTFVNLMSQYRPAYRAEEDDKINRGLRGEEFEEAVGMLRKWGLDRGEIQGW